MEVTLPLWQLLSLAVSVLMAFFGAVAGAWKIVSKLQDRLAAQTKAEMEKQVNSFRDLLTAAAAEARRSAEEAKVAADAAREAAAAAEKDLLRLKADLPLQYVRREDWIRNQTIIEAKLDALAAKIDAKEARHGC